MAILWVLIHSSLKVFSDIGKICGNGTVTEEQNENITSYHVNLVFLLNILTQKYFYIKYLCFLGGVFFFCNEQYFLIFLNT